MSEDRFSRVKKVVREKVGELKEDVRTFDPRLPADEVLRTVGFAVDGLGRGANVVIKYGFKAKEKLREVEVNIDDIRGRVAGFDSVARDALIERTKAKVQRAKEAVRRHIQH